MSSDPNVTALLERSGKKPLTLAALHAVLQPLLSGLGKRLEQLQMENAALKVRVSTLETAHVDLEKKALKGGLPWAKGATYTAGDVVQHDGSLWRCVETHGSGASFSHEHFLLQVKRGRDGRDR